MIQFLFQKLGKPKVAYVYSLFTTACKCFICIQIKEMAPKISLFLYCISIYQFITVLLLLIFSKLHKTIFKYPISSILKAAAAR